MDSASSEVCDFRLCWSVKAEIFRLPGFDVAVRCRRHCGVDGFRIRPFGSRKATITICQNMGIDRVGMQKSGISEHDLKVKEETIMFLEGSSTPGTFRQCLSHQRIHAREADELEGGKGEATRRFCSKRWNRCGMILRDTGISLD